VDLLIGGKGSSVVSVDKVNDGKCWAALGRVVGRNADRVAVRVRGSRMAAERDESVGSVDSKTTVELNVSDIHVDHDHTPAQRPHQTR
jgi:hypothetical protein